tara:strand:+ start:378 stop:1274 length:897 start_codon:yes stop_codon:yes gene_type:complete
MYFGKFWLEGKKWVPMLCVDVPADDSDLSVTALLSYEGLKDRPGFAVWEAQDAHMQKWIPNDMVLVDEDECSMYGENDEFVAEVSVPQDREEALKCFMQAYAAHIFGPNPKPFQLACTYIILTHCWGQAESPRDALRAKIVPLKALRELQRENPVDTNEAKAWVNNAYTKGTAKLYEPFEVPGDFLKSCGCMTVLRRGLPAEQFAIAMIGKCLGKAPRSPEAQADALQGQALHTLKKLSLAAALQASLGQVVDASNQSKSEVEELRQELKKLKQNVSDLTAPLSVKESSEEEGVTDRG